MRNRLLVRLCRYRARARRRMRSSPGAANGPVLSRRERQILAMHTQGFDWPAIAARFGISADAARSIAIDALVRLSAERGAE